MIQKLAHRAPHQATPQTFTHHAPNAALLIDFDNVTMGIRSDLGKELKSLLNSEVIRGKVAVQRAYADWRRYPQYIVPLAESSIDLIFAPAYGSSKKNATDLRMAIDAIELVFTRPEIGTYILMTGDSDFSSCVLKLKEYGKYVIGVGMRESSSDLLIQNCDEYYSYHALSGLTRADEVSESREDPWVLLKRAAQQMIAGGDVMRTDRLKQVMIDLDPGFDEKKVGYSKFSRFVQEAATKGLIRLRKGENGQFEIALSDQEDTGTPAPRVEREPRREGRDRDRGGRGRDRGRRDREERPEPTVPAPQPIAASEEPTSAPVDAPVEAPRPRESAAPAEAAAEITGIEGAYGLLQEAVRQLASDGSRATRDGDVKRKMVELVPGFDESAIGFSKFTRFLRQAHDAEAIDLQRAGSGNYDVSLPASGRKFARPETGAAAAPSGRGRAPEREAAAEPKATEPSKDEQAEPAPTPTPTEGARTGVGAMRGRRGRAAPEGPPPILPGQVVTASKKAEAPAEPKPAEPAAAEAESAEEGGTGRARRRGGRGRGRGRAEPAAAETTESAETPAAKAEPEVSAPAAAEEATAAATPTKRGRGRRGRGAAGDGPPPILPGQVVTVSKPAAEAAPAATAEPETAEDGDEAATKRRRSRGGRGRGRGAAKTAESAAPAFSAEALGLPQDRGALESYLTTTYRGTGKKMAESLLDAFGPDIFRVMEEEPERVRELLGDRRADALLTQWREDLEGRRPSVPESAAPEAAAPEAANPEPTSEAETEAGPAAKSRTRRGGRGRSRKKKDSAPSA